MQSTKIIKRRINSIKSTKQLTKAMEMVSTVKMRRAINAMMANRPFAQKSWEMLSQLLVSLADNEKVAQHPFFTPKDQAAKSLVIFLTDDRGLCGGYHAHLFTKLNQFLNQRQIKTSELDFISVGKKGHQFLKKNGLQPIQEYTMAEFLNRAENQNDDQEGVVKPIVNYLIEYYGNNFYRQVYLIHTNYVNTFIQKAQLKQLLPISFKTISQQFTDQSFDPETELFALDQDVSEGVAGELDLNQAPPKKVKSPSSSELSQQHQPPEYTIEPDPLTVLNQLIPFCLEAQIFQALLESNASVEAARIVAMKNANTAADEIQAHLQLTYNRARQDKITQDITEISAGKSALED